MHVLRALLIVVGIGGLPVLAPGVVAAESPARNTSVDPAPANGHRDPSGASATEPVAAPTVPWHRTVYDDLRSFTLWATLLVAFVFGALGGVVYELIFLEGNLELPHRRAAEGPAPGPGTGLATPGQLMDLGFLGRMLIGGLAGLAVLYWSVPERGVQLVALSVLAGATGIALFRAFQARLVAAIEAARLGAAREAHAAILERVEAALEQEYVAIQEAAVAGEAEERPRTRKVLHEIGGLPRQVCARQAQSETGPRGSERDRESHIEKIACVAHISRIAITSLTSVHDDRSIAEKVFRRNVSRVVGRDQERALGRTRRR